MGKKREYTNGEITVVWEAEKCTHSGLCAKGLPGVFRPRLRPWVKIDAATTEAIVNQVKHCPSGALSYAREGMPACATTRIFEPDHASPRVSRSSRIVAIPWRRDNSS